MTRSNHVTIIGGGLAGCEAAYQAVRSGCTATILEMKPVKFSPAHTMETLAELVCSNSLKSTSLENASGVLKEEMRLMDSIIIRAAYATKVAAGGTLAVDRAAFSAYITNELKDIGVEIVNGEVTELPTDRPLIIASGPLTSVDLSGALQRLCGRDALNFYDAVAPIIYRGSIDMDIAFMASRYDKGEADYINCPMNEDEYNNFYAELTRADKAEHRSFEGDKYYEKCMPVEELASRGPKTLLFGPMKPVGLVDPRTGLRPHAVVQLRSENREGSMYNMVGFQTRLKYPEQRRIFSMIPGLGRAEFARYGKMHRNSYINSPELLKPTGQLKSEPKIFFAGQITGVEGYLESAACGLLAAYFIYQRIHNQTRFSQ